MVNASGSRSKAMSRAHKSSVLDNASATADRGTCTQQAASAMSVSEHPTGGVLCQEASGSCNVALTRCRALRDHQLSILRNSAGIDSSKQEKVKTF